jgi:hypothetical protein
MAILGLQRTQTVLSNSGSLGNSASIGGSAFCRGYSTLVGNVFTAGSTLAACGLRVDWSFDGGTTFDYTSASNALASGASAACSMAVQGDAVRVRFVAGATGASRVALSFYLKPL